MDKLLVEHVAKAIYDSCHNWDYWNEKDFDKSEYIGYATAAIEAMQSYKQSGEIPKSRYILSECGSMQITPAVGYRIRHEGNIVIHEPIPTKTSDDRATSTTYENHHKND